jgi:ATP-dependent helicase/nuclease subunit A
LGRAPQASFSAKGSELEVALTGGDAQGVLTALLTKDGSPRKFNEKVPGIEQVRQAQTLLLQLQAAQAQHEAWLYQQRMVRLTRVMIAAFGEIKRERGWVDMNDVERAALHLLSDPVLGGWVQERLDARIRHLLIDEFQDTNPLQWQALQAWLSGYAGTGGGAQAPSVFIVGDPKQSIYRFRRAEPQVFMAAQQFVVDHLGGVRLSCDHTRRNAPPVMKLVNEVMGQAQVQGEFHGFRAHTTESTATGAVLRLPQILRPTDLQDGAANEHAALNWRDSLTTPQELPEETLRTLECRQAARWLAQQIAEGLHPRDIMVLSRKRDRLAVMQDELRALHIPAQQPEKTDLGETPEVQDIVALLDALVSPAHDLSLARALKSPLFGVGDEGLIELAQLARAQEKRPTWFELLQKESLLTIKLKGVGATLMQYKSWLDTLPPHDALDAIYQHGDVLARFVAAAPDALRASVLANLQALLSAALQIDGGRYATPYALVRALKAGGVKAPEWANADAVRLLTVHGAKGLEAELVLLLDTDAPAPKAQTMGVLVDWPGQAAEPQSFMFLASETRAPASAESALTIESLARQREELNGLYVAMTRARQRLVLSSIQPHRANEASWWQRLQGGCEVIADSEEPSPDGVVSPAAHPEFVEGQLSAQKITPLPFLLPILPAAQCSPARETVQKIATDSPQSLIGQAMHRLLEWAPLGAHTCPDAHVLQVAHEFALDVQQARQAAAMAQRILSGEGAWAWDATELDWHGNEVALTVAGSTRRIDRLVHRKPRAAGMAAQGADGEWWVLDYKSAAHALNQSALVAQLTSYRLAVQSIYPGQTVKAAFLSAQGTLDTLND